MSISLQSTIYGTHIEAIGNSDGPHITIRRVVCGRVNDNVRNDLDHIPQPPTEHNAWNQTIKKLQLNIAHRGD